MLTMSRECKMEDIYRIMIEILLSHILVDSEAGLPADGQASK